MASTLHQHLGSGASMCVLKHRRSVASSMRFAALDSLIMGRRCGALAPGVMLYLPQEKFISATDIAFNRGSNAPRCTLMAAY
ncbi:hypothetical protein [Falsihalocynthiibacter sp. CO-5D18]|uniref:hypothetical protein n=1 Tax=Falsihalocynthiibacter sp. CO-5D18 TaxID=3240872 RepID=UPI00350FBCDA